MLEARSSLPSATAPIRHASTTDGAPDTHEIAFNKLWQDNKEGISFSDVLDIVNPLHHIPVVSTVYRMITGDEIGMGARMAGRKGDGKCPRKIQHVECAESGDRK